LLVRSEPFYPLNYGAGTVNLAQKQHGGP